LLFLILLCLGNFYGFIPAGAASRNIIQIAMLALASTQLLARSLGCALMAAAVGKSAVALMLAGEMALFLLYKVATRDFFYWLKMKGFFRFVVSLFVRIFVKVIVDYTCLLQFR
jgi:hypothetical protein